MTKKPLAVTSLEKILYAVDNSFPVPLSEKQNLKDYAKKLFSSATICAEVQNGEILSMVAGYTENLTGHIANMDCDLFLVNGKAYILELNARFGGGYPFSHMGGCNLPRAIVDWCRGETVDKSLLSAKIGLRGYKELSVTEH